MLPELGSFALILALCFALLQSATGFFGKNVALAKRAVFGQFFFLIIAFFILEKGSMLWWVLILGCWSSLVAYFSEQLPEYFRLRVLGVMGLISIGFLLVIIITSNPYIPLEGRALLLYIGYVGFSVPFAFAISALLTGKIEPVFAKWTRPWTLAAWCFLTLGITTGSGWSWNPVEDPSFMPWLSAIALIHSLIVSEKRNAFHHWTILLAICTFSLSLLGAFHVFAIVLGLALLVYAIRARKIESQLSFNFISRESFLLMNNVLLVIAVSTILLGMFYPNFNTLFVPIAMMILFCMGLGPMCHWGKMPWQQLRRPLLISLILSIIFGFFISVPVAFALFAMLTIFRHMWMTRKTKPSGNRLGMWFAHIGVGICVIGVAMSSIDNKHFIQWIWAGGILIFLGGLCSLSSRKFYRDKR